MAENTNHQPNIEKIRDLLSPYLDGEVTHEEHVLVEQALTASSELRQELESLRQTVSLVSALPSMPAPRPFVLSEADVKPTSPVLKRQLWLSGWFGGVALVATTLVCVLVAGGIFFGRRLSQDPLSEVARVEATSPAMQAVEAEGDTAPAEPAAKAIAEEPEEEGLVEEAAKVQDDTELQKEVEPAADSDVEGSDSAEKAEDQGFISPDRDDSTSISGQTAPTETEAAIERAPAQGAAAEASPSPAAQILPAATSLPQATSTPAIPAPLSETAGGGVGETSTEQSAPALASESTTGSDQQETGSVAGGEAPSTSTEKPPEGAQADEIASLDMDATAGDAPAETDVVAKAPIGEDELEEATAELKEDASQLEESTPGNESQNGQDRSFRDENSRAIEIREQRLQVQPGLIQIEGFIEADAGTPLLASLQRNQLLFDEWADPVSQRGVVQPDGRFSFNIRAKAERVDQDLFALEAAAYQITISSVGTDAPFVATIFFDTFRADNSVQPSTAMPPPTPAIPLPTAKVDTVQPLVTPPAATDSPGQPLGSLQSERNNLLLNRWLIVGAGLLLMMGLLLVGVIIWVSLGKNR